ASQCKQAVRGGGKLYGEPRAAVEIDCIDCHGTVSARASLVTSGPASAGTDLTSLTTPFGEPRFTSRRGRVMQKSMVTEGVEWEVPQVLDTITPGNPRYREASRLAKTIQRDGATWGDAGADPKALAHANRNITCYACHSAWTTSCFGCHLSMKANQKKPNLHNEGGESRNWTSYNFQTLRDDIFFLARDGTVTKNRIAPARSSCAVVVSSQNQNREWIYSQQQTTSSAGFSGGAFSTHVPHTVRATETRTCTDCHAARDGVENAWSAPLLMQGRRPQTGAGAYPLSGRSSTERRRTRPRSRCPRRRPWTRAGRSGPRTRSRRSTRCTTTRSSPTAQRGWSSWARSTPCSTAIPGTTSCTARRRSTKAALSPAPRR